MSNLKKGLAVPSIKVEPKVKKEASLEIASEGVNIAEVMIPSAKKEVKMAVC